MVMDQILGKWSQVKGKAKETWGRFTHNDLDVIRGRRDQLVGRIREVYGVAKDEAERQVKKFEKALRSSVRPAKKPSAVRRTPKTKSSRRKAATKS